jgi:predicted transcriptional regulator
MRGILFVRLLFFSSVACIIFGSIMYYQTTTDNVLTGYSEENELLTIISEDSDQENDAGIENEKEDTDDSYSSVDDKYLNFLLIGSGGISSIIIGAFFSEIFKITILISLVSPLISRSKNSADLLTRGRILGFIESNAGIHFSALRDFLGLANGVTAYHLQVLENKGTIISWKDGKLRRYAVSHIPINELDNVRNPIMGTRLAILEVLSNSGNIGLSNSEISKKLSISRQLMSYHILELKRYEYINDEQLSKRPKWKLTDLGNKILKTSYSLEITENY